MLHFYMNLYYVYFESRIFMSSFVFSLALCIVFILSLYVYYCCYYNNLCYNLYNSLPAR